MQSLADFPLYCSVYRRVHSLQNPDDMAYNEYFHTRELSFQDCADLVREYAVKGLNLAHQSYDEGTYKNSLNTIRQCLEALCWAISRARTENLEEARGIVTKKRDLHGLIYDIKNKNWFHPTDTFQNQSRAASLESIRKTGNPASHAGSIAVSDCEQAVWRFKEVVRWFWADFLPGQPLPEDIQSVLEGILLRPDEHTRKAALRQYYDTLKAEYRQIVLNDEQGMTLENIYVEPSMTILGACLKTHISPIQSKQEPFQPLPTPPSSVHDFVDHCFLEENETPLRNGLATPQARLMILLGQPGQGKTSFCRRFLHDHINPEALDENKVFFVRLRDVRSTRELFSDPSRTLEEHVCRKIDLNSNYLDRNIFYRSVWLLDGLDELSIQDGDARDTDDFIKKLLRLQEQHPRLRILLTSRYGQVDLDKYLRHEPVWIAAIAGFDKTRQLEWLEKYRHFHPDCHLDASYIEAMHNDGGRSPYEHLRELIDQPVLLHLIAIANVHIPENTNRAAIYTQLFDQLIKRTWDQRTWDQRAQIDSLRNLSGPQELRTYIREIAFAIYTSEYEYLRKHDLEKLPASAQFIQALGDRAELKHVLRYLMVAFYMQETPRDARDTEESDDNRAYAVEFLHKSLQEYLVAEKIWEEIKKFKATDRTRKHIIDDAGEALKQVWKLFSKKVMSLEVYGYLREHIAQESETDREAVFDRMYHFAPELLERHFLYEITPSTPLKAAMYTFFEYWGVMAALQLRRNTVPEEPGGRDWFVELLKVASFFTTRHWSFHRTWILRYADLSNADLSNANLSNADLSNANLSNADLVYAKLNSARLNGADLRRANLGRTDLNLGRLQYANLSGTSLRQANLGLANLSGANLSGARLNGANLSGADLGGADLGDNAVQLLSTAIRLHKTKGIPPDTVHALRAGGYGHLFDPPKQVD